MVEIGINVEGVEGTIEVNDHYKAMFDEVADNEDYNGPEEFDEWAANLIIQNVGGISSMVEESCYKLHQQTRGDV